MADDNMGTAWAAPDLAQLQRWTFVVGRMQQMMLEQGLKQMEARPPATPSPAIPPAFYADPGELARAAAEFWSEGMALWQRFLDPSAAQPEQPADRRFSAPEWRAHPMFDLIRRFYTLATDHLVKGVDAIEGVDDKQRAQLRFVARAFADAVSPSNFALTNPQVIARTLETGGENLLTGMERLLADLSRGQLSHVPEGAFELGRNLATTPGKVVHETPLYQLIQYEPATPQVRSVPVIIFPPWINRFYILDLTPEKSFVRWAVAQGLTVFMVSWKSADASMAGVTLDDYVLGGVIDAIDTVRDGLGVPAVHAIGYCVAGTTLAATLALLAARGEADKVASATFFTAQVDFTRAGDLNLFVDDAQLDVMRRMSAETGYTDGRTMAATFNLLRGRDLIWNYVVSNYLLGEEYKAFDLLHWNGDTTNLPAAWHLAYLTDLYRDNKLVRAGGLSVDGEPIDLGRVATPTYVQAGREDHIAPPESVWRITDHFTGPLRFVLAGSGHIAGVVNPPAAGKYQYWTSDEPAESLEAFVAAARETKGSWWPDWLAWLLPLSGEEVAAGGARMPGEGKLAAIEPAPGRYVKAR